MNDFMKKAFVLFRASNTEQTLIGRGQNLADVMSTASR